MADTKKKKTQTAKKNNDRFTSIPGEFTVVSEEAYRRLVEKPKPKNTTKK